MPDSRGVRVGMIGCGAIALAVHLPTLVALPGVAVVSVADPLAAAREAAMQVARNARPFVYAERVFLRRRRRGSVHGDRAHRSSVIRSSGRRDGGAVARAG